MHLEVLSHRHLTLGRHRQSGVIRVPRPASVLPGGRLPGLDEAGPTSADPSRESIEMLARPPSIIVVDDDPDHCALVSEVLRDANYQVETTLSGQTALSRLATPPLPDLILLDLMMPEMDGWAFMDTRRSNPTLATVPVVVMTAGGERMLMSAPVAAGYLAKPLDANRLLQTIERCLKMRKRRNGEGEHTAA